MESDNWVMTILIGGILMMFSWLIIPAFLVYGYLMEVIRESTARNPEPPEFEDWGKLLVDGLLVFVIGIIYFLIPLIVMAITVGGAFAALVTDPGPGAMAGILGGLAISGLVALVFSYLFIAGVINFAREDSFAAAFDIGTITDVATTSEYAVAWLLGIVILLVATVIVGMLNIIPILGLIVGFFINFYVAIAVWHLWADGVNDAVGPDPTSTGHADPVD